MKTITHLHVRYYEDTNSYLLRCPDGYDTNGYGEQASIWAGGSDEEITYLRNLARAHTFQEWPDVKQAVRNYCCSLSLPEVYEECEASQLVRDHCRHRAFLDVAELMREGAW